MLPAGFEPAIPTSEGTQTHALDCASTGIDHKNITLGIIPKERKKKDSSLGNILVFEENLETPRGSLRLLGAQLITRAV